MSTPTNSTDSKPAKTPKAQPKLFSLDHHESMRQTVPIDDIDVPGIESFDAAVVESLADNIDRMGLIHPPTVIKRGVRYMALTGRRRVAALQLLSRAEATKLEAAQAAEPDRVFVPRFDRVEVIVRTSETTSAEEQAALILSENAQRSENVLAELESVNVLLKAGYTPKDVAKSTGQHISWVRHRTILNKLAPFLMRQFKSGRVRFETAQQVARLDAEQQKRVVETFKEKLEDDENAVLAMSDVNITKSRPVVALLPAQMFGALPVAKTDTSTLVDGLRVEPMTPLDRLLAMRTELDALLDSMTTMSSRDALKRARSRVNAVVLELGGK